MLITRPQICFWLLAGLLSLSSGPASAQGPLELVGRMADGPSYAVALSGDYVFLADGSAGLSVFRHCSLFCDGFESGDLSRWSSGGGRPPEVAAAQLIRLR